ncbi:hypothetical protein [Nonomuraea rubra]|uniref:2OG-Fe(II) oxygenase n=2 Tax=Nonomuraea rubra TaxID=46180 RepID=A0A7X0NPK6_9ACTN|nr:hypothetical protein [Nonomuraea rubra]MBB6547285.1 hypothetical protein [Nonomuraea rubra]
MVAVKSQYTYDDSVAATSVYTLFDAEVVEELTHDHLVRLAAGVVGALQIKNFFTTAECTAIVDGVNAAEMGSYAFTPPIAKLGPAAYDFYKTGELGDAYFDNAERDAKARATLLDGEDPLGTAMDRLSAAWGNRVQRATSGGRPMYAGMIREINNSALMHFDEIARECPTGLDQIPVAQLAFNCHLSKPDGGGEAVVFRRGWKPSDEAHRDGYGYATYLTESEPSVSVNPDVGDAIMFDPRNYHLVTPCTGGRRITLSFFVGLTGAGPLVVWS